MPYAVNKRLCRVAFRPFSPNTAPHMPLWTGARRIVTGDEIVTWNTAARAYVHDSRYDAPLYERVCDCGLCPGETCNCAW